MRIQRDIIGKEVLSRNAMIIGRVVDVEIDNYSTEIESLIISSDSGRKNKKEESIPFEMVAKVGDKIILKD